MPMTQCAGCRKDMYINPNSQRTLCDACQKKKEEQYSKLWKSDTNGGKEEK